MGPEIPTWSQKSQAAGEEKLRRGWHGAQVFTVDKKEIRFKIIILEQLAVAWKGSPCRGVGKITPVGSKGWKREGNEAGFRAMTCGGKRSCPCMGEFLECPLGQALAGFLRCFSSRSRLKICADFHRCEKFVPAVVLILLFLGSFCVAVCKFRHIKARNDSSGVLAGTPVAAPQRQPPEDVDLGLAAASRRSSCCCRVYPPSPKGGEKLLIEISRLFKV